MLRNFHGKNEVFLLARCPRSFSHQVQVCCTFHLGIRGLNQVAIQRAPHGHIRGAAWLLHQQNSVLLLFEHFECICIISRGNGHFKEQFMHGFGRGLVDGAVANEDAAKRRYGIAGQGIRPCFQHSWPRGKATSVVVLEHGKGGVVGLEFTHQLHRRVDIEQVVVRQGLPTQLIEQRFEVAEEPTRLVRVFSVAQ